MRSVSIAVDAFFEPHLLIILAVAIVVGLWRGRHDGVKQGMKAGGIAAAIGIGLVAVFAVLVALYYAGGGH